MIDVAKLRQLAEAAQRRTPGPYRVIYMDRNGHSDPDRPVEHIVRDLSPDELAVRALSAGDELCDRDRWDPVVTCDSGYYEPNGVTAEHIAANSPDVTLALLDRIAELEAGLRRSVDLALNIEGVDGRDTYRGYLGELRALADKWSQR